MIGKGIRVGALALLAFMAVTAAGGSRSSAAPELVDAGPIPLFPGVEIYAPAQPGTAGGPIRVPYSQAMVDAWGITDEQALVTYARDRFGLWQPVPAVIDADRNEAFVSDGGDARAWTVARSGILTLWQSRRLVGLPFEQDTRNLLIIHSWNAGPWDGCTLALTAALVPHYDRVEIYQYPSGLDIGENGDWLRREVLGRYPGVPIDIVGASVGGLVGRAAVEGSGPAAVFAAQVRRLVMIGAPHFGEKPNAPVSFMGDVSSGEMRSNSLFLALLNARQQAKGVAYYSIAGNIDDGGTSDGLVTVASALGTGLLHLSGSAQVPLWHAALAAPGMPCAQDVYSVLDGWLAR